MHNCWERVDDFATLPVKSESGRPPNLLSHLVLYKKLTLLTLFRNVLTSSFYCDWFEKATELLLSVIHTPCSRDYLQALVKIEYPPRTQYPGLEILSSGECSSGGRLPRWVLEGKGELPHVAGMTSSLCTGPPFHMRSNPPTLFSLPVSLHGKQLSVRAWQEINANTNSKGLRQNPCVSAHSDLKAAYLRSISMTFKVSSNRRNFIS